MKAERRYRNIVQSSGRRDRRRRRRVIVRWRWRYIVVTFIVHSRLCVVSDTVLNEITYSNANVKDIICMCNQTIDNQIHSLRIA